VLLHSAPGPPRRLPPYHVAAPITQVWGSITKPAGGSSLSPRSFVLLLCSGPSGETDQQSADSSLGPLPGPSWSLLAPLPAPLCCLLVVRSPPHAGVRVRVQIQVVHILHVVSSLCCPRLLALPCWHRWHLPAGHPGKYPLTATSYPHSRHPPRPLSFSPLTVCPSLTTAGHYRARPLLLKRGLRGSGRSDCISHCLLSPSVAVKLDPTAVSQTTRHRVARAPAPITLPAIISALPRDSRLHTTPRGISVSGIPLPPFDSRTPRRHRVASCHSRRSWALSWPDPSLLLPPSFVGRRLSPPR
jgi:hypothetical protein